MSRKIFGKKIISLALAAAMLCSFMVFAPLSVQAAGDHILPENAGDVGKYTNGESDVMDIGDPTYNYEDEVAAKLEPGVAYTAGSMHQSIFEKDLAAGGTDYYLDRVLGVRGNIGGTILQTRGRSLYMRGNSTLGTMGFAGSPYAGGRGSLGGNLYTVTVAGQTVSEDSAQRFNAPSHFSSLYNIGSTGVQADMKKFITFDNVAVTAFTFTNTGSEAQTFTVQAQSAAATNPTDAQDELAGKVSLHSGSVNNNGLNNVVWSEVTVGLKAKGFVADGSTLKREITVPAGESVDLSVVGVVYSDDLPDSKASFYDYVEYTPAEAFKTGVTEFNRRWAEDIPYIDVPSAAIEKAIVYRWWGERYNSLDTNESGYVYQFPVTIEGVNLYQNSIVLTQPMHLQDTKWHRTPYLAYGQILNLGELSGSSAFLDSPGAGNWNNHYSQYMGTAGLEAYNVHGGGADIAGKFAYYFESDGKGQLDHYDGDDDMLIAYTANYMPGNDSDALTFGFPKAGSYTAGSNNIARPESAYVWGDFDAASQLYAIAGAGQDKIDEMDDYAGRIQAAILDNLWSPSMKMFLAGTTRGRTSAATSGGTDNPLPEEERNLIPARESNLYDVYAQNLIPAEDYEDYVDGFRFLTYGDNFPIFPFYTANQYDKTAYSIGGSNNFSNINFTVQYRGVRSALRHYDPDQKYITPEYAARLLDWMAWSVYPNADLRVPNQAEYYSNWNATAKTYNRNNTGHIMLGNMNYIYVEDMGGIQPRSDDVIELWPIDFGYEHFMVNNLRYHGNDVTIVWDPDGTRYNLGAGYSLFINGERVASADKLGRFVYDPNTNTVVEKDDGLAVTVHAGAAISFPTAKDTPIEDNRVVNYLKHAGVDLTESTANLATSASLSASYTQEGARDASWRNFHTPGWSTSAMNYDPGSISTQEQPVSLAAVTDGVTVNEPYWGNYGITEAEGYVELDFGSEKAFDNVKVFFVTDGQSGGYKAPQRYVIQVPEGDGWKVVSSQAHLPKYTAAKFNEALFDAVTASKVRVAFTNDPGYYTAISEIQVFNSGREVPPVVNDPPTISSLAVENTQHMELGAALVATVVDDGIPYNNALTFAWSMVSGPDGAEASFADPAAARTVVTGTKPGEYVLKFVANDGEFAAEDTLTVTLVERGVTANLAPSATITTSGTASWEDHSYVNRTSMPASSSQQPAWGNWGQTQNGTSEGRRAWLQYSWEEPQLISSCDIYWYDDSGGTRTPRANTYSISYSNDGENWTDVVLEAGSSYADGLELNKFNYFNFETITAKHMRVNIWGVQSGGAGTGMQRWKVYSEAITSIDAPVIMRTAEGEIPTLPATLGFTYKNGQRGSIAITWEAITPEMVAESNTEPFVVTGTNSNVDELEVEAHIYVRSEMSEGGISITGVEQFAQSIKLGQAPALPAKASVSYNDGSSDNQNIGIEWEYDPSILEAPGTYTIQGNLVLPWYVSESGITQTTLTLTVEGSQNALSDLYFAVKDTDPALYTTASWEGFAAALAQAKTIVEMTDPAQEQIDDAYAALTAAYGALALRALDFELAILSDFVALYDGYPEAMYTPASWAPFKAALDTAKALIATPANASSKAVNDATDNLLATGNALQKALLKSPLEGAVRDAEALLAEGEWIPASAANLQNAIDKAKALLEKEDLTQAEMVNMILELNDAMSNMFEAGNKRALQLLVSSANRLDSTAFTPDSWTVFADALTAAQKILDDANATTDEVGPAYSALSAGIRQLVVKANTSGLETAIALAGTILANADKYVPSSIEGLTAECDLAQAVLGNGNATQSEVDAAEAALMAKVLAARKPANKQALKSGLGRSSSLSGQFNQAGTEALSAAMVNAEQVANDPNAPQEAVDAANTELNEAMSSLAELPVEMPVIPDVPVENSGLSAIFETIRNTVPTTTDSVANAPEAKAEAGAPQAAAGEAAAPAEEATDPAANGQAPALQPVEDGSSGTMALALISLLSLAGLAAVAGVAVWSRKRGRSK